MRHRKTTNTFGISRGSVLVVIKRVSFAITTFSGPEPIKFPSTKKQKELTDELLETHKFPQCIWTRDDTHIDHTKWTLLGLYRQKKLFSPERLSCVRLKLLISKRSDKRTRKRAWLPYVFWILPLIKCFEKEQHYRVKRHPIPVFLFGDSAYLCSHLSRWSLQLVAVFKRNILQL